MEGEGTVVEGRREGWREGVGKGNREWVSLFIDPSCWSGGDQGHCHSRQDLLYTLPKD